MREGESCKSPEDVRDPWIAHDVRLQRERFDAMILLTNSLRTGFWAWYSGAKQRVGYARDVRSLFLKRKSISTSHGSNFRQPFHPMKS